MTPVIVKGQAVKLLQQVSIVAAEFLEEKRCGIKRHNELMSARRTEEFEFQLDLGRKAFDGFSDQHFLGAVDLYAAIVEQTAKQQPLACARRGKSENGFLIGPGRQPESQITLPPGVDTPKDLPAIVMPHGGPSARDYWGFNWLAQFYASRGYVVLQPNFRGSTGYGDEFFKQNGFRSWPTAIGDVLDAGRWLVAQGIASPDKMAVVGWSYGGYAALQSAVVDPGLFKAVIAVAPVTDLVELKEQRRQWSDFVIVNREIGDGPHVREGSPALNAAKIKVPVLLFHGEMDRNVLIRQSREMADRLAAAGVPHELVTWPDLDHDLEDSAARAEMLRKSDAFLRKAMGL